MLIAQLSDLHLTPRGSLLLGRFDAAAALEAAVARINGLNPCPDRVILSGDLANSGAAEEYAVLREILAGLAPPYYLMPGNHDDRARLRQVFPEQAFAALSVSTLCCQRVVTDVGILLLLDTVIPGEDQGMVAAEQLDWLDRSHPPDQSALLFMHHPPFDIGIAGIDELRCRGEDALAAWLDRHSGIEAVITGHVHRFVVTRFAGRLALTAPSLVVQIAADLDGDRAKLNYSNEPGAFLLHSWRPGFPLCTMCLPLAAPQTFPA